ncbi:hypothetical protein JG687_00014022 [Phytophthora cactorum]|uniref:Uncharacterized protein n=1 Tax=Phytophthora cactorum TaxID=29920 RepID=A0A8T1TZU4_9STRA|nr:hypothetical protein JG687_00014022 [Phytophthora cactorum]
MRLATRQEATLHMKNFALVQGKQVQLNPKLSGVTVTVYFEVYVRLLRKTKSSFTVCARRPKSVATSDFDCFRQLVQYCIAQWLCWCRQGDGYPECYHDASPRCSAKRPVRECKSAFLNRFTVHRIEGLQISQRMSYRARVATTHTRANSTKLEVKLQQRYSSWHLNVLRSCISSIYPRHRHQSVCFCFSLV